MTNLDKITNKIQKLFALAGNNPSQQEAQAALLKAQALMAEYGLTEAELSGSTEVIEYICKPTAIKAHKFNNALATLIAQAFASRVILVNHTIHFFGRKDNAEAAALAYQFAFKAMSKGGHKATRDNGFKPGHAGAAPYYNSYVTGFIAGVRESLGEQTVALAIVVPQDVNDAFQQQFPNIRTARSTKTAAACDYNSFCQGKSDGKNVMAKRSITA